MEISERKVTLIVREGKVSKAREVQLAPRPVWALREDDPEPVQERLVMRRGGKRAT